MSLPPPLDPLVGSTLRGSYRLERRIGTGGAGAVYEATQLDLGRKVAVKVLRPELATDAVILERFRREARVAAGLHHPHIALVLSFEDPRPPEPAFMALELVPGTSLLELLRAEGRLAPARAVRLTLQVLSALEVAHGAGIVHRDLKPGNLMVTSAPGLGESVKLLDFGIAQIKSGEAYRRLTQTGAILGTPRYMAPEQISGRPVDARSDVWAIGVVLYRMLAGTVPFEGTPDRILVAILSETPPRMAPELGVSSGLQAIVVRALSKRPEDRFQSAGAMMEALSQSGLVEEGAPAPRAERDAPRVSSPPTSAPRSSMPSATRSEETRASTSGASSGSSSASTSGSSSASSSASTSGAPGGMSEEFLRASLAPPPRPSWIPEGDVAAEDAPRASKSISQGALGNVSVGLTILVLVLCGLGVVGIGAFLLTRPVPRRGSATAPLGMAPLPGDAPRTGDIETYRAVAELLARRVDEDAVPLGFSLRGEVDPLGRIDFDRSPSTSVSFLYRLGTGCRTFTILPRAPEEGSPIPCSGETLPSTLPPLPRIVAQAWSTCPAIPATDRITVLSASALGGEMQVTVTNAAGHPLFIGSVSDGAITPDPELPCVP